MSDRILLIGACLFASITAFSAFEIQTSNASIQAQMLDIQKQVADTQKQLSDLRSLLSTPVFEHACDEVLVANTPQRIDCGFTDRQIRSWSCSDLNAGGVLVRRGHSAVTTSIGAQHNADTLFGGNSDAYLVAGSGLTLDCTVGL